MAFYFGWYRKVSLLKAENFVVKEILKGASFLLLTRKCLRKSSFCDNIYSMEYIDFYKDSNVYKIISADVANHMISHAYMLTGKDIKLLDEFSKLMTKQILCNFQDETLCRRIDNNNYPDVKTYPLPDKKNIVVDDVKEIIDDSMIYPYEGSKKIYILKNLEESLASSQNKLLKTLEEPSSSVIFILVSASQYKILPTIRSRCNILKVEEPSKEDIIKYVKDLGKDQKTAEEIVDLSSGSLANVHKLLEDEEFSKMQRSMINIFRNMNSSADLLFYSGEVMNFGSRLEDVFDEFLSLIRDLMVLKAGGRVGESKNGILGCEKKFTAKALNELSKLIVEEKQKLKANCNPNGVVENFLMKILEVKSR